MHVSIKVIGFSADERHALQTLFHLSEDGDVRFKLWHPGDLLAPNVLLLDADSHEAALEVQSPAFRPHTKSIVVGQSAIVDGAWKVVSRPLQWKQVLRELEALFTVAQADIPIHEPGADALAAEASIPPGYKTGLIVGLSREQQFYLKARLSLQGIAHVVEAADAGYAAEHLGKQGFDIVIVSCSLPDANAAALIQALHTHVRPPHAIVVVIPHDGSWALRQEMENLGVAGVLDTPFTPHQVCEMFARL